jgi:hypothetical protein
MTATDIRHPYPMTLDVTDKESQELWTFILRKKPFIFLYPVEGRPELKVGQGPDSWRIKGASEILQFLKKEFGE